MRHLSVRERSESDTPYAQLELLNHRNGSVSDFCEEEKWNTEKTKKAKISL